MRFHRAMATLEPQKYLVARTVWAEIFILLKFIRHNRVCLKLSGQILRQLAFNTSMYTIWFAKQVFDVHNLETSLISFLF